MMSAPSMNEKNCPHFLLLFSHRSLETAERKVLKIHFEPEVNPSKFAYLSKDFPAFGN